MNNKKVSVVIRNKNEAIALEKVLDCLHKFYLNEIDEIIVVDNNSTDNSLEIAKTFGCKIVPITNFSYGRAINYGIEASNKDYILLLSSHAIPVGKSFLKNSIEAIDKNDSIAGIRYINSFNSYERAIKEDFIVKEPLSCGLMAACCMINRKVWENTKFNEDLLALEDKDWSRKVIDKGFKIIHLNETYFYFIERSPESSRKRYKNETISEFQLSGKGFPPPLKFFLFFIRKMAIKNTFDYFRTLFDDLKNLKVTYEVHRNLKK